MAMFLDAFMSKFSTLLTDFVQEEVTMVLGVKDELQKLQRRMWSIQTLLNDAEKRKFDDSSLEDWLSQLKDVMYDAEDVIDLCRIEGAQLLANQNLESKTSPVCCNFSSSFSCFTSVPLSYLELHFIDILNPSEEHELAVEELFDKILPPQSLEELKIFHFFGRRFPNWMTSSFFEVCVPYLTRLVLKNISCAELPPLGQLPALRELEIDNANKVKKIGPEFLGGDVNSTNKVAFPKLEKLLIIRMLKLEEWSFGAQVEENASPRLKLLPCLQELEIKSCGLLKQLPKGLKHSAMKLLDIFNAGGLESVDNLPTEIEELHLLNCVNLKNIHCPPTLKILYVHYCEALSCVEKLDSLQKMFLSNFDMESLPEWLLEFLRQRLLQNNTKDDDFLLELYCTEMLSQKCKGGSYWNLIKHIPQVMINWSWIIK